VTRFDGAAHFIAYRVIAFVKQGTVGSVCCASPDVLHVIDEKCEVDEVVEPAATGARFARRCVGEPGLGR
jgi:hypothetical protein